MERTDVQELVQHGKLRNQKFEREIQETHISWVLFTSDYVLKIKKPVKLTFLDFSTLDLRKFYCEQEVLLNSRFSEIYLGVEALSLHGKRWTVGEVNREVMEYGVVMKRQDSRLRMDILLSKSQVSNDDISQLAQKVACFHNDAVVISAAFQLDKAKELFRDLRSVIPCLEKLSGTGWTDVVEDSIRFSDEFLTHYQEVFIIRIKEGNVRDVHGDLHSRNIFLTPEPVIFDCIEFNATFRQIDVWYEVAFLCMEMEYYGHRDFSMEFFKEYTRVKQELVTSKDMEIFTYFKMLRANIRAKVLALQASEEISIPSGENLSESIRYLGLMKTYIEELKKGYLRKT